MYHCSQAEELDVFAMHAPGRDQGREGKGSGEVATSGQAADQVEEDEVLRTAQRQKTHKMAAMWRAIGAMGSSHVGRLSHVAAKHVGSILEGTSHACLTSPLQSLCRRSLSVVSREEQKVILQTGASTHNSANKIEKVKLKIQDAIDKVKGNAR